MNQPPETPSPAAPSGPDGLSLVPALRDELARKDVELARLREELRRKDLLLAEATARPAAPPTPGADPGGEGGSAASAREAEERLLSLFDGINLAIAVSRDGVLRFVNRRLLALLGHESRAEVVGRKVTDFVTPRYHGQVHDRQRARRLGTPLPPDVEHAALRKDGTEVPFHMVATPVELADGPAVIGILTDVSEQQRGQRALRRQVAFDELLNELLAGLASASGDGVDHHIGVAVREIGLFVGAEEAHLLLHEPAEGTVSALFTWSADGAPLPVEVRGLPIDGPFGWMLERVRAGQVVALDGPDDIPVEAEVHREFFRLQGTRSVLYVPMRGAGGRVRGALWLRSFSRPIQRTDDDLKMLRMMSDAIAAALDRKQAEESLRESERRLRSIATATPTFLIEIDEHARIRYINRTLDAVTESMVIGTSLRDWVAPAKQAEVDAAVAFTFATGKPARMEHELHTPSGQAHTYIAELCAYPGAPSRGALLSVTDVSEWKRMALALTESEGRLRNLFENAPSGIFHALTTGQIVRANPAVARMMGYDSAEEMMAAIADQGIAWLAEPEAAVPALSRALESTEWVQHDARILRRDRSILEGRLLLRKVLAEGGDAIAYIEGFVEDLTERRRAEQERDQLFNLSVDLFCVSGLDGYLKQWNPAVERLLGWSADELGTRPFLELIHPEDRMRLVEKLAAGVVPETTMSDEYRVLCRDGSARSISFSSFAVLTGGLVFTVGRDVTEARRAEEARRQLETQLMHAQKMEGIGRLAGGIAHDFNNILAVILSYATFAQGAIAEGDPVHDDLQEIEVAATRGSELTRQLLAFSRKSIIKPVILDLNLNLAGLERMIQRIVGEDVAFQVERADGLWPVRLDPSSVDQIMLNLVVNARDAMPTGGRLTIETRNLGAGELGRWPEVTPGEYVLTSVSDTGVGMSAEVLQRLFEPFFTTKREGKGTGLGLATVYGVVKQYGGYVFVTSEPGQGARFDLLFPRSEIEAVAPVRSDHAAGAPAQPATVLVVDDEASLRRIAVRTLQSRGYQVLEAETGAEAIDKAVSHQGAIDVVLADVIMPGMSGRQMVEELQRERPAMRALYMSGYTDDTVAHHGIARAEVQFLQKPFTPGTLLMAVANLVGSGAPPPPSAE